MRALSGCLANCGRVQVEAPPPQGFSEISFCSVSAEQGKGSNGFLQRGAGDVHGQPGKWSGPLLLQEGAPTAPQADASQWTLASVSAGCHRQAALTNALTATGLKSKIKLQAGLVPLGRLSSWLAGSCLLTVSSPLPPPLPMSARVSKLSCVSFYKDTNLIMEAPS